MKVDLRSKKWNAKRLPWRRPIFRCILHSRSCDSKRVIIPDHWGV